MTNRITDPNELIAVEVDDDDSDAKWTVGFDLPDPSAAYALSVSDTCITDDTTLIAGTVDAAPLVYHVMSFGAVVGAKRNVRCANGEEVGIVAGLLDQGGIPAAAEYALWNGVVGWDPAVQPSLQNTDVSTVSAAATPADSLAAAVVKYASLTAYDKYVVHLGIKSALDLSATGSIYLDGPDPRMNSLRIRAIDAPVVVSPYYPPAGIAVTGPLAIRVGTPSTWQAWDYSLNRTAIRGYRLIAIAFDPSTSVRVV